MPLTFCLISARAVHAAPPPPPPRFFKGSLGRGCFSTRLAHAANRLCLLAVPAWGTGGRAGRSALCVACTHFVARTSLRAQAPPRVQSRTSTCANGGLDAVLEPVRVQVRVRAHQVLEHLHARTRGRHAWLTELKELRIT